MIRTQEAETKQEGEKLKKIEEIAETPATLEFVGTAMEFQITTWQLAPNQKLTKEKTTYLLHPTQEQEESQRRREEPTKVERHI